MEIVESIKQFFRTRKSEYIKSIVFNLISFVLVGFFYWFKTGLEDWVGFIAVALVYSALAPGLFIMIYEFFRRFCDLMFSEILSSLVALLVVVFFIFWVPLHGGFTPYKLQRLAVAICLSLLFVGVQFLYKKIAKKQR